MHIERLSFCSISFFVFFLYMAKILRLSNALKSDKNVFYRAVYASGDCQRNIY